MKAFGALCDRVRKMKLQAGSYVNLLGRLDEDEWTDKEGVTHHTMVIVLDEIEYALRVWPKKGAQGSVRTCGPSCRSPTHEGRKSPSSPGMNPSGGPHPLLWRLRGEQNESGVGGAQVYPSTLCVFLCQKKEGKT